MRSGGLPGVRRGRGASAVHVHVALLLLREHDEVAEASRRSQKEDCRGERQRGASVSDRARRTSPAAVVLLQM